jgi:hypothetical protein
MRRVLIGAAALVAAGMPVLLVAQTWRTFDVARQARDSQPLAVHVQYMAGRVRVAPALDDKLYDMHLRFDAQRVEPVYSFDATTRTLEAGVRQLKGTRKIGDAKGAELHLMLSRSTPLRLQLDIGAAEGDFDLSGLPLETLALQTGATDTRMRFDAPNPRRMQSIDLQVGAASLRVTGLANANAERLDVNLGVGQAILDFSGAWRGDLNMSVNSALGKVTLLVPNGVGVRVESSTFLHSFDGPGMIQRDGNFESENWSTAEYKLSVRSSGALGRLEVQRIAR